MSDDLHEQLLASLRAAGTVEAEGALTVDFAQAREKLRDYLLPDPRMYILTLMQHASAAGARHVTVTRQGGRIRVFHDGTPPTASELTTLFGQMFFDGGNRSLPPLAIALNAALGFPEAEVCVSAWDGVDGQVVRATAEGMAVHPVHVPHGAGRGLVFDLKTRSNWLQRVGGADEGDLLRERCLFVPFNLALDAHNIAPAEFGEPRTYSVLKPSWQLVGYEAPVRPLMKYFPKRHHALEVRLWSSDPRPGRVGVPVESLATSTLEAQWGSTAPLTDDGRGPRNSGQVHSCRAVLAVRADLSLPGEVVVVVGGVRSGMLHFDDQPGLYGAVAMETGATDLSGLSIQRAGAERLAEQVKTEAARLYAHVASRTKGTTLPVQMGQLLTGEGMRPRA